MPCVHFLQHEHVNIPKRSFCGSHFINLTFSGTSLGTTPVYRHTTCKSHQWHRFITRRVVTCNTTLFCCNDYTIARKWLNRAGFRIRNLSVYNNVHMRRLFCFSHPLRNLPESVEKLSGFVLRQLGHEGAQSEHDEAVISRASHKLLQLLHRKHQSFIRINLRVKIIHCIMNTHMLYGPCKDRRPFLW